MVSNRNLLKVFSEQKARTLCTGANLTNWQLTGKTPKLYIHTHTQAHNRWPLPNVKYVHIIDYERKSKHLPGA